MHRYENQVNLCVHVNLPGIDCLYKLNYLLLCLSLLLTSIGQTSGILG